MSTGAYNSGIGLQEREAWRKTLNGKTSRAYMIDTYFTIKGKEG